MDATGVPYTEVTLDQLAGEQDAFRSFGECRLKVTKGDKIVVIKVRVTSVPQEELDKLRQNAPTAPGKLTIDPTTRQKIIAPDLTDPKYQKELDKYNIQFVREVVGRGLDEPSLKLNDGRTPQTPEEWYHALEEKGLATSHFAEIAKTILGLTDWSDEERERFL